MLPFLRPNDFHTDDRPDYSAVFRADDGREVEVGRVFLARAGIPKDTPWVWTVEFHQRKGRAAPHDGYAADFEAAKAAWKRCWESGNPPINWPPSLRNAP